jgi:hypothetical protein
LTWARIGRNQPPAVSSRSQPESIRRCLTAFAQVRHRLLHMETGGGGQGRGRTADLPLFRCRRCPGRRDRRSVDGCPRAPIGGTGCRHCRHGCRHATESTGCRCQVVSMLRTGHAAPGRPGQAARPARARPDGALPTQARLDLAVLNGLFVRKPTGDADCQGVFVWPDSGQPPSHRASL